MRSAKIHLSLQASLSRPSHPWTNPVVPGDHPDPTIIEVDGIFWASATSGEWSPQFPLFRSTDLLRWTPSGAIFPAQPTWAEGSFWAPELVHDELTGRFVVWYVGKKRNGPLCIAVATAPSAAGPYTDQGPLICEPDGSIDPCFARDENGAPYLIWKEDGNSQQRPTPIWAQPLTPDLLHLTGEKTQLITNDQPWEEGVVEGPYILRHDGRFYMFYAGNSCCGRECKYAEGVARADHLLGPWEKCPANPIIGPNDNWRCPGHGTAVHSDRLDQQGRPGQDYLLYHAYPAGDTIYVGREAILDKITWSEPQPDGRPDGKPGWPSVNAGHGPSAPAPPTLIDFTDPFDTPQLGPSWQWPVNTRPDVAIAHGTLTLGIPLASPLSADPVESAMIAVPRPAGLHYTASVVLDLPAQPDPLLWAGLSIVGDPFNTAGLGVRGTTLSLWSRRGATQQVIWQTDLPSAGSIHLRAHRVGKEHHLQFSYALVPGDWHHAGESYDASDLPAWDRGLRIGLMLEGPLGRSANFHTFELRAGQ